MSIKKVYEDVKNTLVQDDNPNSPHKVIERMNDNINSNTTATPEKDHNDNKNLFSSKAFEKMVWGDKEGN